MVWGASGGTRRGGPGGQAVFQRAGLKIGITEAVASGGRGCGHLYGCRGEQRTPQIWGTYTAGSHFPSCKNPSKVGGQDTSKSDQQKTERRAGGGQRCSERNWLFVAWSPVVLDRRARRAPATDRTPEPTHPPNRRVDGARDWAPARPAGRRR